MTIAVATLTRPADTNAYTAHDAIADKTSAPDVLTFASAFARASESMQLKGARIISSKNASVEVFKLYLYSASPTTPIADNVAMDNPKLADQAKFLGSVTFGAVAKAAVGSPDIAYAEKTGLDLILRSTDGTTNLYAELEGTLGETPVSAQTYHIELELARI